MWTARLRRPTAAQPKTLRHGPSRSVDSPLGFVRYALRMDETIRLLHLSDLHAREGTAWDANRVRQTLIEDLNDPARADLRPDLVLFTGDLAWAGKPEQFERGWTFLDAVLKACDLDREALFLVPGNHDVDRSKINMFVRDWLAQADHAKVEDLIQAGGDNWLLLTQRLDAYRA
ncbi:MAG: metallophosphoesterase, partial [Acidobacteriota bacterium]